MLKKRGELFQSVEHVLMVPSLSEVDEKAMKDFKGTSEQDLSDLGISLKMKVKA